MRFKPNHVSKRSERRQSIFRKEAKRRGPRPRPLMCEALEDRWMLSGVTLTTHGFQVAAYPAWVDAMGDEVANRIGEAYGPGYDANDVAQYHIEIGEFGGLPGLNTISLKSESATTHDAAGTGEVVVTVDWSDVASGVFGTSSIAEGIANTLAATYPGIGISSPLAALPIHLIGHSRGASVIGALAEDLGQLGIWVEQATYLDTHPFNGIDWGDPFFGGRDFRVTENVQFADSYWRKGGWFSPNGEKVPGGLNVRLNEDHFDGSPPGYGELEGDVHADAHLWYHGTVDDEGAFSDGEKTVADADAAYWYSSAAYDSYDGPMPTRITSGYNLSRVVGGDRPNAGVATNLDGSGMRREISIHTDDRWPSLVELQVDPSDKIVSVGENIDVDFYWHDYDSNATLTLYLDSDRNPYTTGNQQQIGMTTTLGQTWDGLRHGEHSASTTGIQARSYSLFGKITDGTRTRYAYAPGVVTVVDTANGRPVLSNPTISPRSGNTSTQFQFTVDYFDPDNTPPTTKQVYVYNNARSQFFDMTRVSGSQANGTYSATTTLPAGSYRHQFIFDDGQLAATISNQSGPNVSVAEGTALSLHAVGWNDPLPDGDNDSVAEPGEKLELEVKLQNNGGSTVTDVIATLTPSLANIRVSDNDDNYGAISSGQAKWGNNQYHLEADIIEPQNVTFTLDVNYEINSIPYHQSFNFTEDFKRSENEIVVHHVAVVDDQPPNGDGDNVAQSGEFPKFDVYLKNITSNGSAFARDVRARIIHSNVATFDAHWQDYPDLHGGGGPAKEGQHSFSVTQDPIPLGFTGMLTADIEITWSGLAAPQVYRDVPLFNVESEAYLSVSPREYDFGVTDTLTDVVQTITLRNIGSKTATVSGISTSPHTDTTVITTPAPSPADPWLIPPASIRSFDVQIETQDLAGQFVERTVTVTSDARNTDDDVTVLRGLVPKVGPPYFQIPGAKAGGDQLDVSGDIVVWAENRSGDDDIFAYDLSSQTEFAIATGPGHQNRPKVGTNLIVWRESSNIYGYYFPSGDLASGQRITISTDDARERPVGADGSRAVFTRENQAGVDNLWWFDAAAETPQSLPVPGTEDVNWMSGVDFSGGLVVWTHTTDPRIMKWECGSATAPVAVANVAPFGGILRTNGTNIAWVSGEGLSHQQVWIWPPATAPFTEDDEDGKPHGDYGLALGDGIVAYNSRIDGAQRWFADNLSTNEVTAFLPGDWFSSEGIHADGQLVVWGDDPGDPVYYTHFGSLTGPDLSVSPSDLTFSDQSPVEGSAFDVNVTVHNVSTVAATSDIRVRLYDGYPGNGGTQLGTDQVITGGIPGRGLRTAVFEDLPVGLEGTHNIYADVVLLTSERRYNSQASGEGPTITNEHPYNNQASTTSTVRDSDHQGPAITDITVSELNGDGDGVVEDGESIRVSWSLADPSGIASTEILVNGVVVPLADPLPTDPVPTIASTSAIVAPLTAGRHVLVIRATDADTSPVTSEFQRSVDIGGAALTSRLVRQPTPFDDQDTGEMGALPSDEEWIDEWTPHWVEIWGSTPDTTDIGIASFSLDVTYETDYFTATEIQYGPAFTGGQTGTIVDSTGHVNTLGGSTSLTDTGDDQYVLLARIKFEPTENDPGVPHNADGKYITPVDPGYGLSSAQVTLVGDIPGDVQHGTPPDTELWPVMFDIDDSGRINFADLSFFAAAFDEFVGQQAGTSVWASDFDRSGRVNFADLSYFAANFDKGRMLGLPVSFPCDLPGGCTPSPLTLDGTVSTAQEAVRSVTAGQLSALVDGAASRLSASDQDVEEIVKSVRIEIVDLPDARLGQALGDQIWVDTDAAGHGWFVDATPWESSEFERSVAGTELLAEADSPAAGRVDLLTVVMHELGHVLGYEHVDHASLMSPILPLGTRRLIASEPDPSSLTSASPEASRPAAHFLVFGDILDEISIDAERDDTADWAHDEFFALLGG